MSLEFIEKYYREYFNKLLVYAEKRIKDRDRAYDLVQETFLAACRKPDEFMNSENPAGWLYNALKYRILHEFRARKTVVQHFVSYEVSSDEVRQTTDRASMEVYRATAASTSRFELMEMVDEADWELLRSVYLDNIKMTELSCKLGISYEACKKRVQKARRKLSKAIEEVEK